MPDAVSLGPLVLAPRVLAGLLGVAVTFLALRLAERRIPDAAHVLRATSDRLTWAILAGFAVWKLTPLVTWWDAIVADPVRLMRLPGGRPGVIAGAVVAAAVLAPWLVRRPSVHRVFGAAAAVGTVVAIAAGIVIATVSGTTTAAGTRFDTATLTAPTVADGTRTPIVGAATDPTLITFFATWCGPCHAELPVKAAAFRRYGTDANVIAVNLTRTEASVDTVRDYVRENAIQYPVFLDPEGRLSSQFGVRGTPTTVVLSPDGVVVDRWMGPSDLGRITRALEQARAPAR